MACFGVRPSSANPIQYKQITQQIAHSQLPPQHPSLQQKYSSFSYIEKYSVSLAHSDFAQFYSSSLAFKTGWLKLARFPPNLTSKTSSSMISMSTPSSMSSWWVQSDILRSVSSDKKEEMRLQIHLATVVMLRTKKRSNLSEYTFAICLTIPPIEESGSESICSLRSITKQQVSLKPGSSSSLMVRLMIRLIACMQLSLECLSASNTLRSITMTGLPSFALPPQQMQPSDNTCLVYYVNA